MNINHYLESEPPHIALLKYLFFSCPPAVVLDIGSCEGEDSIRYQRLFPSSKIIAFEPIPSNLKKIEENLLRYNCPSVEVVPVALSDRNGIAKMHVSTGSPADVPKTSEWDYGNKSSSLLKPAPLIQRFHGWLKFESSLEIQTRKLDSILNERAIDAVDFIHMDVQGAELMVLHGSTNVLPFVSCLWLEVGTHEIYKGQPSAKETQKFLESWGFIRIMECLNIGSGDHFYVNPKRLKCVNTFEANA